MYPSRDPGQLKLKLLEAAAGSLPSVGGKTVIIDPGGWYGDHLNTWVKKPKCGIEIKWLCIFSGV